MLGAIAGDVIGSRFERSNRKSKSFELFTENSHITDDSVMSIAIQDTIRTIIALDADDKEAKEICIETLQRYGRDFPGAGYGNAFYNWIFNDNPKPYNSFGNGAIMRVTSIAFELDDLDKILHYAELVTEVTHNHPQAIKAAKAICEAIYVARTTKDKAKVMDVMTRYGYIIPDIDTLRKTYKFDVSCDGTIPAVMSAFIASDDFEDAIRNAISLGGDSDTIACIVGALAEAYYGEVPEEIKEELIQYVPRNIYKLAE